MKCQLEQEGNAQVTVLSGRLDSDAAAEFEHQCMRLIRGDTRTLLLDLGKLADAKKGRLSLCPAPSVRQILKLSGFDKILAIRDSVQDALVE